MANRHPSAIKRNRVVRSRVKSDVRKVREAADRQDQAGAERELRAAIKEISKAASKGILHRNNASRRIARLSKRVAALSRAAS